MNRVQLTILFDGACPYCLREISFLKSRDKYDLIDFVDIDSKDYDASRFAGISYQEAMGRIHALDAEGTVITDIEVFYQAYKLIGLGWIYAPSNWPVLKDIFHFIYLFWARYRLVLTNRPPLEELCRRRD